MIAATWMPSGDTCWERRSTSSWQNFLTVRWTSLDGQLVSPVVDGEMSITNKISARVSWHAVVVGVVVGVVDVVGVVVVVSLDVWVEVGDVVRCCGGCSGSRCGGRWRGGCCRCGRCRCLAQVVLRHNLCSKQRSTISFRSDLSRI